MKTITTNKQEYIIPKVEIIDIETENVLAASGMQDPGVSDNVTPPSDFWGN